MLAFVNVVGLVGAISTGLVAGGFVTMLVYRVPRGARLTIRSRCPACTAPLLGRDIIPVVAWVLLRGRCRHCGNRITWTYPLVEVATSALWVAVILRVGWGWPLLPPLVLVVALMALSVVDMYSYRLPDRLVFPALGFSMAAMTVSAIALADPPVVSRALLGMCLYFGFLLVVHLLSPRGMGFGDVKFSLLLGLHLGWVAGTMQGDWGLVVRLIFWTQLLACLLGVIGGFSVAALRQKLQRRVLPDPDPDPNSKQSLLSQSFPFGPALACATMTIVLFAESVPTFYFFLGGS